MFGRMPRGTVVVATLVIGESAALKAAVYRGSNWTISRN